MDPITRNSFSKLVKQDCCGKGGLRYGDMSVEIAGNALSEVMLPSQHLK
jgi:hypothetical protein